MVAGLWKGAMDNEWHCWCPSCGEELDIDILDNNYNLLEDGNKEWLIYCPECGQGFYVSETYND